MAHDKITGHNTTTDVYDKTTGGFGHSETDCFVHNNITGGFVQTNTTGGVGHSNATGRFGHDKSTGGLDYHNFITDCLINTPRDFIITIFYH